MSTKHVLLAALIVLLVGTLGAAFNIQKVKASGTVYIRADGTIDPHTAPIEGDGTTYNFTDDINDQIVVMRSNIIVDGKGHTLQGSGIGIGFSLTGINNVIIRHTIIQNFTTGVFLDYSHNNVIFMNAIQNNSVGVSLYGPSSTSNDIRGNTILYNGVGVEIDMDSKHNWIFYNVFIGNGIHARVWGEWRNYWDLFDLGGNLWENYTGVDESPEDGIGDTPHVLNVNNTDYYPLMGRFWQFCEHVGLEWYCVLVISSSEEVSGWFMESIGFNVTGPDGTDGFCRVTIPHGLLEPPYAVTVNDNPVTHTTVFENETLSIIYFTYTHSTQKVVIVPELPSFLILPLFMIVTLLATVVFRRKIVKEG